MHFLSLPWPKGKHIDLPEFITRCEINEGFDEKDV